MRRGPLIAAAGLLAGLAAWAWWRSRAVAGAGVADGGSLEEIDITAERMDDPAAAPVDDGGGFLESVEIVASQIGALAMSRGYRNRNPGNIRTLPASRAWRGQIGDDGGYGVYDTAENGTRALGRQLRKYESQGIDTVRAIIARWAPAADNNNEATYVAHVCRELGVTADQRLNVSAMLPALARAIAKHENGYVASDYNWEWANL